MLMTAMLSLGVIVTLLGVVATRYWRRIRRRRELNLPPGYVQIGQGQLAYSPAMLIGQGCNGVFLTIVVVATCGFLRADHPKSIGVCRNPVLHCTFFCTCWQAPWSTRVSLAIKKLQ